MELRRQMDLKQQMEDILQVRYYDSLKELRLVREFRKNLKMSRDISEQDLRYMQAFSDTYLCEAYLRQGHVKKALEVGMKALKVQVRDQMEEQLMLTYNCLGIISGCMENFVGAYSMFSAGIAIARTRNNWDMLRILYANFGVSYIRLHQYEAAKELFDKSHACMKHLELTEERRQLLELTFQEEYAEYYLGIGEYEKVMEYIHPDQINYELYRAKISMAQNREKDVEISIGKLLEQKIEISNFMIQYEYYYDIVQLAIAVKHPYYTKISMEHMLESVEKCDIAAFWASYYESKIKACEQFGWEMDENCYEKYFEYHQEVALKKDENQKAGVTNEYEIFKNRRKQKSLAVKNERLRQSSMRDDLTKVYNRLGFQTLMQEKLQLAKKRNHTLCMCMVDLDYFKKVNDQYGHLVGDQCLIKIARVLKEHFPKEAAICRYGGDEFALIVEGSTLEELENTLQVIQKKKKEVKLEDGTKVSLTLSIGAVICEPDKDSLDTDYIYTADKALYEVKNASRNQYRISQELI